MPMSLRHTPWLALALAGACSGPPPVPEQPTWADVEPILRGQCNHCHGATAETTGSMAALTGAAGGTVYRMDFFDSNDGACGAAAEAISPGASASALASLIQQSVASVNDNRPRMPPSPAPLLSQWEREVIDRWTHGSPVAKGGNPWNRMPRLQVYGFPATADDKVTFTVILSDPDEDPVIGVINAGGKVTRLDRAGLFTINLDTKAWPKGKQDLTATLCDGWGNQTFEVGQVEIAHAQ
jgi:hypothetical protein